MLYRRYIPNAPLRELIEDLWLADEYAPAHFRERIVPSGTIELVINLRDDEVRIYRSKRCDRFSGTVVSGAYTSFFVTDTAEEASIMGVHFKPGGAFAFLGVRPDELTNTHVDLQSLWGRSAARELRERLCLSHTPEERFQLLERVLLGHLSPSREPHYAIPAVLTAFERSNRTTVRQIARDIGLSQRHVIEVFKKGVGLTPKLYSRMRRFHRAFAVAQEDAKLDWARLAQDCGYFDQSHLIHDFVEFTGFTPTDYLRQQTYLRDQGVNIKRNHLPVT
jgi:AraC-like DNA-binding protein